MTDGCEGHYIIMMQEVQRVKFCLFRTMIIYEDYHMCIKCRKCFACVCVCTALCTSIARNNRFQLSGFQSRCFSQLSNMLKLGLLFVMVVREDIYLRGDCHSVPKLKNFSAEWQLWSVETLSYYKDMLVEQRRLATQESWKSWSTEIELKFDKGKDGDIQIGAVC